MATDLERVRAALAHVEFPADKDELVRCAVRAGADGETISAMLAIPPVSYANMAEVEQSVYVPEARPEASRYELQRGFTAAEFDELEQDIAEHPIWRELGDNSGS